jgi:hypothetical protein
MRAADELEGGVTVERERAKTRARQSRLFQQSTTRKSFARQFDCHFFLPSLFL